MPTHSELPGDLSRKKFTKALKRLGFIIDTKGGDGSHIKAIWPPTQKSITLQTDIRKDVLYHILKETEQISGVTWEDIKSNL